jgi:hypothetical protein
LVGIVGHILNTIMKAIIHVYDAYIIIPTQIGNLIKSKS